MKIPPDNIVEQKQILRQYWRRERTKLSRETLILAGSKITELVVTLCAEFTSVAAFVPIGQEPSLDLQKLSKFTQVLLPVVDGSSEPAWSFLTGSSWIKSAGPGRPAYPKGPVLPAAALSQVDLVLVPALAIDRLGNRLGQGGGWYDRALQHLDSAQVWAVVPDQNFISEEPLPHEPHDKNVDGVIVPQGCFRMPL